MTGRKLAVKAIESLWALSARGLDGLGLKSVVRDSLLPRLLAAAGADMHGAADMSPLTSVGKQLKNGLESDRPIILGPWMSEVGFEVLYWIPFLRRLLAGVDPQRVTTVTRGGAGLWYEGIAAHQFDIFDVFTPQEFKARLALRWNRLGGQKQISLDELDESILAAFLPSSLRKEALVIHPHHLNTAFRSFWKRRMPVANVIESLDFARFSLRPPRLDGLPERYVAVRVYFNQAFEDTPHSRARAAALIGNLAARVPIVMLNTGLELDDHIDFGPEHRPQIIRLEDRLRPRDNLEVQTRVIAHAQAFVGTYGGLSYLPLFYGIPSVGLVSTYKDFSAEHLYLAREAARCNQTAYLMFDDHSVQVLDLLGM